MLLIPIGCDSYGKQKIKIRTSEELVSTSTLEEERGEKNYELLTEKGVKDYKCAYQSTLPSGLLKVVSQNPNELCDK